MGIFWGVAKISNIFWGCLIFLIFFGGWTVGAGSKSMHEEKMRVPPGGYICTYIHFFCFDFYLWHFYFIFCVLNFVFRKISFLYCLLPFAF